MTQPPPTDNRQRLIVNKALRRRSGMFGVNTGLAIITLSIITLGVISASFLPLGVVVGLTLGLVVATIYIFRDGTDPILSRFRKPRNYTRGGLNYVPVIKNVKEQKKGTKR
jgi:hypothetical protein